MAEQIVYPTDPRFKDISGTKINRWTVLSYAGRVNASYTWHCRCDCGQERVVNGQHLRAGRSKSCGCLQSEITAARNAKHGYSNTPEYDCWRSIKFRCFNSRHKSYANYGGRGITICDRWRESFDNFLADMGHRPSDKHSIDRIDNDGNYEPTNCRWAVVVEQLSNRRNNVLVTRDGVTMTATEFAAQNGISRQALYTRLGRGQTMEHAISALLATKRQASPAS